MTTTTTKADARKERVNDLIGQISAEFIKALEDGIANPRGWEAPWHRTGANGVPTNAETKNEYRGMNAMWLTLLGGGYWATYRQWAALGGQVRKGEKGATILKPMPVKKEEEQPDGSKAIRAFTVYGTATVFHYSQQDGWEAPEMNLPAKADEPAPAFDSWKARLLAKSGIRLMEHNGPRAYYDASFDTITMPSLDLFKSHAGHRSTFTHEAGHATGHKDRLARIGITDPHGFGSDRYAYEELVAELTSATMGMALGISTELREDHRDYLANWVQVLRSDPQAIMDASREAQAAAKWLLQYAEDEGGEA